MFEIACLSALKKCGFKDHRIAAKKKGIEP
jgi:hypothetical protein